MNTVTLVDPGGGNSFASLQAAHRSIPVPAPGTGWAVRARRLAAFAGPGYLVAVGYMDPGNWATSLAGGSQYGMALVGVILASNLMAMLFQAAAVRLGLAGGTDLARACREHFPPSINRLLWLGCEAAIVACNLAEVLGMAIGLNLLLGIALPVGVLLTALDVALVLALQRRGFRSVEAAVAALVGVVALCFIAQLVWAHPTLADLVHDAVPTWRQLTDAHFAYLAVGIVGATVMPHNLYLHSAVVQTRRHDGTPKGTAHAIRCATIDSNLALGLATFVNVAILVVAACTFHRAGQPAVVDLSQAYRLISPLLGVGIASTVFGIALLASGLSASVTGTLAGQVVMEGFLAWKLSPARRALATRALALGPALLAAGWFGSAGAGKLLIFSQVVLSLQLPFALVPLLLFTTRKRYLGRHAFAPPTAALLWLTAAIVIALDMTMLLQLCRGA
ncbi:MAG: Nramp family divalent metal transporter [Vitreoscilla sp.]